MWRYKVGWQSVDNVQTAFRGAPGGLLADFEFSMQWEHWGCLPINISIYVGLETLLNTVSILVSIDIPKVLSDSYRKSCTICQASNKIKSLFAKL